MERPTFAGAGAGQIDDVDSESHVYAGDHDEQFSVLVLVVAQETPTDRAPKR